MKSMKTLLLAASGLIAGLPVWCAEVTINENRVAVIDGKPTFIMGLYENPEDDAVLKGTAESRARDLGL